MTKYKCFIICQMKNLCWCESGKVIDECHGVLNNSINLLVNERFKIELSPDVLPNSKTNIFTYLSSEFNDYELSENENNIEFRSKDIFIDYIEQTIWSYPNMSNYNNLRVPSSYTGWIKPKDMPNNFIANQFNILQQINNVKELNDLFNFQQAISYAFFVSDLSNLQNNGVRIVKEFQKHFEEGYVDFITISRKAQTTPILFRILTKQSVFGFKVSTQLLNSNWKEHTPGNIVLPSLNILFNLFGNGAYGFVSEWIDKALIFTYGTKVNLPFAEYAALYVKGSTHGFVDYSDDKNDKYFFDITPQDFRIFTGWYINQINIFLNYIYHLFTFADPESLIIDPVDHYKKILTIEQIVKLILRILGSDDSYIKKLLTIQLLDILANWRFANNNLNELFATKFTNRMIQNLSSLPESIKEKYVKHTEDALNRITNEIWENVPNEFKKGDEILLPNGSKYNKSNYIGLYIRQIRNTIHGYVKTEDKHFEEVLFINSGEIPKYLPEIVPLIFLNMIIQPNLFFPSKVFTNL